MKFVQKSVEDLNPAAYNPRIDLKPGDPEFEKIRRSIQEFGYVDPIIYNARTGNIVGGHQRFKVLVEEGYTSLDVVEVDLSDSEEKALNLALNKISGDWDMPKLRDVLEDLDTGAFDIELTGFDMEEIEDLMTAIFEEDEPEIREDDFDPEEVLEDGEPPMVKPGEVWQLGKHRLMCGDSTSNDDMVRLVGAEQVDLIFTDPPYNVDYTGGTKAKLKIANDNMEDAAFYQFLLDSFVVMFQVAKPGAPIYICHADSEGRNFRSAFEDAGWLMKQCLIWVKNSLVLGRQDYHWRHEPILYGWKPGGKHAWYGGRKQSTVLEQLQNFSIDQRDDHAVITVTADEKSVVLKVPSYEILYDGDDLQTTTWFVKRPSRSSDHPTMKPVELCGRAIQNSSAPGAVVLDPFGGSGSTLIAAEQIGRRCFMMEFEPKYADVVIKRWEKFTGEQAVKLE